MLMLKKDLLMEFNKCSPLLNDAAKSSICALDSDFWKDMCSFHL